MHFAVRIDSRQIPGPIKRAWTHIELSGIMKDNPGGRPTKVQREEAKEAVEARCAEESKQGNFKKMTSVPILWDSVSETLFVGNTSEKTVDGCLALLNEVFGLEFSKINSGKLALEFADSAETTESVFDATPASFHPESNGSVVWWNGMKDNYDFLGNEFLLWLWWKSFRVRTSLKVWFRLSWARVAQLASVWSKAPKSVRSASPAPCPWAKALPQPRSRT